MRRGPKPSFRTSVPMTAPKITLVSRSAVDRAERQALRRDEKGEEAEHRQHAGQQAGRAMTAGIVARDAARRVSGAIAHHDRRR